MRYALILGDGSASVDHLYWLLSTPRRTAHGEHTYTPFEAFIGPQLATDLVLDLDFLRQYSVVLMVAGDIFPALKKRTSDAIRDYVEQGGVLLATPFVAWSVSNKGNTTLDDILPVSCSGFFEGEASEWTIEYYNVEGYLVRFGNPRTIRLVNTGELLTPKLDAFVFGYDLPHNKSVAACTWHRGRGVVSYLNCTHHRHGAEPLDVWHNESIQELVLALLGADVVPNSLNVPKLEHVGYWDQNPPDITNTHRNFFPEGGMHLYEYADRVASAGKKKSDLFYHSHTTPAITRTGGFVFSTDQGYQEFFDWGYGPPRSDYTRLVADVPQIPYLYLSDRDLESMTDPEKVAVCRFAFRGIRDDSHFMKLYRFNHYEPRGTTAPSDASSLRATKGQVFEVLCVLTMLTIPGIGIERRNLRTATGELDALLRNNVASGFWKRVGSPIAIECKYWDEKVATSSVRAFASKLIELGIKTGIMFSKAGISGDEKRDAVLFVKMLRKTEDVAILSLDWDDLQLILRRYSASGVIEDKYYELYH